MKCKTAILGILAIFMLISSAMACHWMCDNTFPSAASSNYQMLPGQMLTFTPADSAATYTWTVYDTNGDQIGPSATTTLGAAFTFTAPNPTIIQPPTFGKVMPTGYSVTWSATKAASNTLTCIDSGCIKIWLLTKPNCPSIGDWCIPNAPTTTLSVTMPTGTPAVTYTYNWAIDGVSKSTTSSLPGSTWAGVAAGSHTLTLDVYIGTNNVMACSDPFVVGAAVVTGVTVT